ncbi:MAG: lytic transglycosylase domain-containing protein [Planctomycetota bacterium]
MDRDTRLGAAFFLLATVGVPMAGAGLQVALDGRPSGPLGRVLAHVRERLDERGIDNVAGYGDLLTRAAAEAEVEAALLGGIMFAESRGRPGQTSSAGALGLMQLVPGAARDAARRAEIEVPGDDRELAELLLRDDALNVRLGAAHLRWLLDHRGEWSLEAVLVSYNAGRARLFQWIDRHGSYGAWVRSEEEAAARGAPTTGALAYARQVLAAREALRERAIL